MPDASTPEPDRFLLLHRTFEELCVADPSQRTAALAQLDRTDPDLAAELRDLLSADDGAASRDFLAPLPGVGEAVRQLGADAGESGDAAFAADQPTLPTAPDRDPPHRRGPLAGRHIGGFRLERLIASGGMGAVYLARQERPERDVAFKVLRDELPSDRLRERFRLEAEVLARLQHPGIATILASGTEDGRAWLAMEYVPDARSVTRFARETDGDIRARVRLVRDITDAVRHAHQRGVIHRDLKPANLLVGEDGRPRVIDFGIARSADVMNQATRQTSPGELLGTLAYMSPEQCAGDPDAVDVRTDVYALGVVLHELVTGSAPFDFAGVSLVDAVTRISREGIPRLAHTIAGVDPDLQSIVRMATALDPADRYQGADALHADLDRWLAGQPIAARRPGPIRRLRLFARRHPVRSSVMLAGSVSAAAIAVLVTMFTVRLADESAATHRALDRSERMLDFMGTVMMAGSDRNTDAPTTRLEDVMRVAARRVGDEFADDPVAAWRLREAIGLSFRTMGATEDALEQFQLLEEIADTMPENQVLARALALGHQGSAYFDLSDIDAARASYAASVELYQKVDGVDPTGQLAAEQAAHLLETVTGTDPASDGLRDLLEDSRAVVGEAGFRTVELKESLAIALTQEGRVAEATQLLREVLAILDMEFRGPHPQRANVRNNLAHTLATAGSFDEAILLGEEALGMYLEVFGPDHPSTTWTHATLLETKMKAGLDPASLETEARDLLAARRRTLGDESLPVAMSEGLLWRILGEQARHEEALPVARAAHERTMRLLGPGHPRATRAAQWVGLSLSSLGRHGEALELLEQTHERVARSAGPMARRTALAGNELGIGYARAGRWPEAAEVFRRVLAAYDVNGEPSDPERVKALGNLGRCLLESGRLAEARPYLEEACALVARIWEPDVTMRLLPELTYVEVLAGLGERDAARERFALIEDRIGGVYAPGHPRRRRVTAALAADAPGVLATPERTTDAPDAPDR